MRGWSGLVLTAAAVLAGCGGSGGETSDATAIPRPASELELDPLVAKRIDEAVAAVEADPDDATAWATLGMVYDAHSLGEPADRAYRRAAELDPRDARWPYHRARVATDRGDAEAALALLDESIAMNDRYAPAHVRRGFLLLEGGDTAAATAAFERAGALDPAAPAPMVGLARVALQEGRPENAIRRLEALVSELDVPYFHQLLGTAYQRVGRTADARVARSRADGSVPAWNDPWRDTVMKQRTGFRARLELGEQLLGRGQAAEAVEVLESLRTIRPDDPVLLTYLAEAYMAAGNGAEALAVLEHALEKNPDVAVVHATMSRLYEAAGRFEDALPYARRAVELNPADGRVHLQVGRLLTQLQRYDEAIPVLREAFERGATGRANRLMLGQMLLVTGRMDEAAAWFKQMIDRFPGSAPAFAGLAVAVADRDPGAARGWLQQARRLDPNHAMVRQAAAELQRRGITLP